MATAAETMISGHFRLGGGEDLNARVGRTARGRPRMTRLVEVRSKTMAPLVSVPETVAPPVMVDTAMSLQAAMAHYEKQYLIQVLQAHQWHRARAASVLGIDRRTLFRKMKSLGIPLPERDGRSRQSTQSM